TGLARRWQRVGPPQDLAGLGVHRGQAPAHAEFAAGDAAVDDAVVIYRRVGDPVTVVPVFDRRAPHLLARLHFERHDIRVELAQEQHPLAHRQPAVQPAAADGRDLLADLGPMLPEDLAGLGVEREYIVVASDDIHDAVLDEWRRLERILAAKPRAL